MGIFIVLSGYCLTHSVLQNDRVGFSIRDGPKSYFLRRARRILPAYYAAIAICLVLAVLVPTLATRQNCKWDGSLPILDSGVIVSHLFLVHNFSLAWTYKLDYPLWSVATEWQIYFVFPLLLIGFKRLGVYWTALLSMVIGWAIVLACNSADTCLIAAPWFLGFFGFGAACAVVKDRWWVPRIPVLIIIALGLWFSARVVPDVPTWNPKFFGHSFGLTNLSYHTFLQEMPLCISAVLLIVYVSRWPRGWAAGFMNSRPIQFLGKISYSLYVIHAPVLAICFITFRKMGMSSNLNMIGMLTIAVGASVAIAYGLYRAVERPFMSMRVSVPSQAGVLAPAQVR